MINTTSPMPIIILALMFSVLLPLSECEERRDACTYERSSRKHRPQRHVCAVAGFRNIRSLGDQLIMEFRDNCFLRVNRDGHIIGEHICLCRIVRYLRDHIVADTKSVNIDLSVFIGYIGPGEGVAGNIRALHFEGEALKLTVLGGLLDSETAGLCLIDKALAGRVFNNNRCAVFLDGEGVGFLVKIEPVGSLGFLQGVFAVFEIVQFVYAVGELLQLANRFAVLIHLKFRAA
jgi:hypothetical protein